MDSPSSTTERYVVKIPEENCPVRLAQLVGFADLTLAASIVDQVLVYIVHHITLMNQRIGQSELEADVQNPDSHP